MTVLEYKITTSARTGTLTAIEAADHVRLTLKFDKYGILGDEPELERELRQVLAQFGRDAEAHFGCEPRPIVLSVPAVGERSLIIGGVEQ
jgi:hypothetical protein